MGVPTFPLSVSCYWWCFYAFRALVVLNCSSLTPITKSMYLFSYSWRITGVHWGMDRYYINSSLSLSLRFIYVKGRVIEKGDWETEIFHVLIHSPNGLGQTETTSQELHLNPLCGCRGPDTWAIFCHFPRCVSRSWMGSGTVEPWSSAQRAAPQLVHFPAVPPHWLQSPLVVQWKQTS